MKRNNFVLLRRLFVLSMLFVIASGVFVFASEPPDITPTIVTGGKALLQDVLKWILILLPFGAATALGWQGLNKSWNPDEENVRIRNKRMKNIFVSAAIAETATGLIQVFLSYF